MERLLDAARCARGLTGEWPMTLAPVSLRESIVQSIDRLESATTPAGVWSSLKSFATQYGLDYMLVLKGREELASNIAPAVLYDDMPKGFAESFDRAGHSPHNPLVLRAFTQA